MELKLMRLPHGTNRNRTLRKVVEFQDEDVDLTELNRLFRRFWHRWKVVRPDDMEHVSG